MTGSEFNEWLECTGVRPVDITDEFGTNQAAISEYRSGRRTIPDEFVETVLPWGASKAHSRAEYARVSLDRFLPIGALGETPQADAVLSH